MRGVNEDRVLLWINALESGEYTQCQGVLERDELDGTKKHCCLGVAQRVAFANGFSIGNRTPDDMYWGEAGMNSRVGEWYGFDAYNEQDPILVDSDGDTDHITCVDANDKHHWNFARIAAALRERYISPPDIEQES